MPHIDLLELPYFTGISIDVVVSLIDAMAPCTFPQGSTIMAQDGPDVPPLYIATAGRVGIFKRIDQKAEQAIAELAAPTVLGEVELFCHMPAVATARALSRVEAFALTHQTFETLFAAGHPGLLRFVLNMAKVACHRLAQTDALICSLLDDENRLVMRRKLEDFWPPAV